MKPLSRDYNQQNTLFRENSLSPMCFDPFWAVIKELQVIEKRSA
jgi:hypothetical protein